MDRDQFWTLVEQTKGGDCQQHADRLTARLRELGPAGILAFQAVWDQLMDDSYRWDLWGAAYLANGGCSDDGFDYFRGWLIGQGRKVSARCAGATREYGRRYASSMTTMREASRTVLEDVVRFARCFNRPSAGGV